MFKALVAGVPVEGVALIQEGLSTVFGDVEVRSVNVDVDRMDVREAANDSTVVFVSFDKVSEGRCSDFAEALINSDKYYAYTTLTELAEKLNSAYGVSLVVPDEVNISFDTSMVEEIEETANEDAVAAAKAELAKRVGMPVSAPELPVGRPSMASTGVSAAPVVSGGGEADELRAALLAMTQERDRLERTVQSKEMQLDNFSAQLEEYHANEGEPVVDTNKVAELEAELRLAKANNEVLESKLTHTSMLLSTTESTLEGVREQLSTLTRDRLSYETVERSSKVRISELEEQLRMTALSATEMDAMRLQLADARNKELTHNAEVRSFVNQITDLTEKVRIAEIRLSTAQATAAAPGELETLRAEVARLTAMEERIRKYEKDMNAHVDGLEADLEAARVSLAESEQKAADNAKSDEQYTLVLKENSRLTEQVSNLTADIGKRDKELIELRSAREETSSLAATFEDMDKVSEFKNSIFGKIQNSALPKSAPPAIDLGSAKYKNIMFMFAGNQESTIDVYKRLQMISGSFGRNNMKGLIIDLSQESNFDYEFLTAVKPSTAWFENGGSLSKHIVAAPKSPNTSLMSGGGGEFLNESYLLTIDWAKRLDELNRSGYKVIIYLGNIGSLVGRSLYQTLAGRGRTKIYAKGSISSVRFLYSNLKSFGKKPSTSVQIYDYRTSKMFENILGAVKGLGYEVVLEAKGRSGS